MAPEHTWKGDPAKRDPWREWIRKNIPGSSSGYVFEDLDLVARRFYTEDPIGRFMLIEMKYADSTPGRAQVWTFGLIDRLLRTGDPKRLRYFGYYLFQYPNKDPLKCTQVTVNGKIITIDELKRFLTFELEIPPYEFPHNVVRSIQDSLLERWRKQ